ncbi:helix-turn-helix transcriptional regulator [uncultured Brevibacillus sp.]|uniref:ArsR/SmtB family transcription factor n=1 Tax=uncultured Brevibacillus sp. TaxID=169970 RepID=UPI002594E5EF|nr:metalloregulator ArsR/SmtB family transcription factor [uncultured Brevibacillus sp.]
MIKNEGMLHDHCQDSRFILNKMPEVDYFLDAAAVFQQLSDGSRLRILWLLCHCDECGNNIAAALGMSPASVSHHLKTLKLHGLIRSRRARKEVYYSLADNERANLVHKMVDDFFQMSCPENGLP